MPTTNSEYLDDPSFIDISYDTVTNYVVEILLDSPDTDLKWNISLVLYNL